MNTKRFLSMTALGVVLAVSLGLPGMASADELIKEKQIKVKSIQVADNHPGRGNAYGHDQGGARHDDTDTHHAGHREHHDDDSRKGHKPHGHDRYPRVVHQYPNPPVVHHHGHHRITRHVERHYHPAPRHTHCSYREHRHAPHPSGHARIILNYPFWY